MPGGRPTDYAPEHCDKVIEWGKLGKSKAWMCSRLDISRQTMANWAAAHPEFLDALTRAMEHAQAHWEDLGQDNIKDRDFNSHVWGRSMGARFPEDWREKTGVVGGGKDDPPVKIEQDITFDADAFTRSVIGLAARERTSSTDGQTEPGNQG